VAQGFPPENIGGVEVYLKNLARKMAEQEKVFVFTRAKLGNHKHLETDIEVEDRVEIMRVRVDQRKLMDFRTTYQRDEVDAIFRNYLLDKKPDVVHIHHLGGLSLGMVRIADELSIPVILTLHDHHPFCPRGQRIRNDKRICTKIVLDECLECLKPQTVGLGLAAKLAMYTLAKDRGMQQLREMHKEIGRQLERVSKIISPSRFHQERLVEAGAPEEKTEVLPYGLDLSLVDDVPAREKNQPVKKFGYLGTLIPSKGVDILILAFKKLKQKDLELHIFGEAAPYHGQYDYDKRLKELARGLNVFFHGSYQPHQLPEVLAQVDCVVLPSRWYESFGITLREAVRAKRPVIVSDIGSFKEGVRHNENGLVFKTGDMIELFEMMQKMADNPSLAGRLVEKGIAVETLEDHCAKLSAIYSGAVAVRKAGSEA
jgi:glycosyltransferase involved in cell wall biosynthesis